MDFPFSHFCLLAGLASFYISSDVRLDVWPPVVPGDQFLGLVLSRVSSGFLVMVGSNDVSSQCPIFWHIDSVFPGYHSFFSLPFLLFIPQCPLYCPVYPSFVLCQLLDLLDDHFFSRFHFYFYASRPFFSRSEERRVGKEC